MNFSVLSTGGTIGSAVTADGHLAPTDAACSALLQRYLRTHPDNTHTFRYQQPLQILSESLNASLLMQMLQAVRRCIRTEHPDGIILLHGSDTIAYTAAVLSFLLCNETTPVVLVSSAYALSDPRENGSANFSGAIRFLESHTGGGVFVSNQNQPDQPVYLHRGTRLLQQLPFRSDLFSIHNCPFGWVVNDVFVKNPQDQARPQENDFPQPEAVTLYDTDAICNLSPVVGMRCPTVLPPQIRAILHSSYHSGTICISPELTTLAQDAKAKGIPFFLTGMTAHELPYETTAAYKTLGIRILPDAAPIAMYCRLWLAICAGLDPVSVMQPFL